MPANVSEYRVRKVSFSRDEINGILIGAAGFNPQLSVVEPGKIYTDGFDVVETVSTIFGTKDSRDPLDEINIKRTLAWLDEHNASKRDGNGMARAAAEIIRALLDKDKTDEAV